MQPEHAAIAAEALRETARVLAADVRPEATHARAIELLHRRAEAYDRIAAGHDASSRYRFQESDQE